MWPYWLLFMLPAAVAVNERRLRFAGVKKNGKQRGLDLGWFLVFIFIGLMIGFRNEVGGDWFNYFHFLEDVQGLTVADVLMMRDPGYHLINWLSLKLDGGIFGVNLVCGFLFTLGLVRFCRSLPRSWLALAVAVPYMVLVLAMGYSRQAVALGLAMLGLVGLMRGSTLSFVIWVVLGATFHKTAVLLLPIAALSSSQNRYLTALWVGMVTLAAYGLLLQEAVDVLYSGYIEAGYQSEGALIRLLMNAIPASVLLLWWKRFSFSENEASLWRWFSIISLVLLVVLFVSPSSTAVDRIALYMLPLQLVVFSYFPEVFGRLRSRNQALVIAVLSYYVTVQFVWLNFAGHADYWLPYRFYPLELL
jgi:hypothetical protein